MSKARLHGGVAVRGVVVHDQMQHLVLGSLALILAQEFQRLDMGVVLLALADDLAIQHARSPSLHTISGATRILILRIAP